MAWEYRALALRAEQLRLARKFINIAVAAKLAHLQHDEWLALRPKAAEALMTKALAILDRPGHPPEEFDKIPAGYVSVRRKPGESKRRGREPSRRPKTMKSCPRRTPQ